MTANEDAGEMLSKDNPALFQLARVLAYRSN